MIPARLRCSELRSNLRFRALLQNSQRIQWTEAEVDDKLKNIMEDCYNICFATAKRYAKEGESESC